MNHGQYRWHYRRDQGFTLIELVVVIIVIGILAAIVIPVYLGQRDKAARAATKANMRDVISDVMTAREEQRKPLLQITGSNHSQGACLGTVLKVSDPGFAATACGARWTAMTGGLAAAAGVSPTSIRTLLTDGWGRPIMFDENEGETQWGACSTTQDGMVSTGGKDTFTTPNLTMLVPFGGLC